MFDMIITARVAKRYLKDNQHDNLHLARKYAGKSVLGHYKYYSSKLTVFLKLRSRKTVGFPEQIMPVLRQLSQHIFEPN